MRNSLADSPEPALLLTTNHLQKMRRQSPQSQSQTPLPRTQALAAHLQNRTASCLPSPSLDRYSTDHLIPLLPLAFPPRLQTSPTPCHYTQCSHMHLPIHFGSQAQRVSQLAQIRSRFPRDVGLDSPPPRPPHSPLPHLPPVCFLHLPHQPKARLPHAKRRFAEGRSPSNCRPLSPQQPHSVHLTHPLDSQTLAPAVAVLDPPRGWG